MGGSFHKTAYGRSNAAPLTGDNLARLGHVRALILRIDQGREDFTAGLFGQLAGVHGQFAPLSPFARRW
jgi:hypothetical protein